MTTENSSSLSSPRSGDNDDYEAKNNNTPPLRRRAHSFMTNNNNNDEDIPPPCQRSRETRMRGVNGSDDDDDDGNVVGGEEKLQLLLHQTSLLKAALPMTPSPPSRFPHNNRHTVSEGRQRRQSQIMPNRDRANTCPHYHNYTSTSWSTFYHEEEEGEGGNGSSSSCDVESGRRLLNFDNHQLLPPDLSSPDNDMMEFSDSSSSSNNSTRPIETTTTTGRVPATSPSPRRSDDLLLLTSTTTASYYYNNNNNSSTNLTNTTTTLRRCRAVIQILQRRLVCLSVIKLCMIISLFVLLDIAWLSSDLRYKYHSADVHFVLGEYWHGGMSNRVVVSPDGGGNKIFNDDISSVIGTMVGRNKADDVSGRRSSLDDTTTTTIIPSSLAISGVGGSSSKERTTLIPPSLSYARSSTSSSSSYYHGTMKRATRPSISKSTYYSAGRDEQTASTVAWSLWQAMRAIIWFIFALPVIETAVREIRRRRCIGTSSRRNDNLVMSR